MFSAAGLSASRSRNAALHMYPSVGGFSPHAKEPFRRGVMFTTVAALLVVVGAILTWLGFSDIFGGRVSMTGPLLIALAALIFLFSLRQFLVARKRRREQAQHPFPTIAHGTVTAMVIDREDDVGTVTVVMDTLDFQARIRRYSAENYAPPDYEEATSGIHDDSVLVDAGENTTLDPQHEAPPAYEDNEDRNLVEPGESTTLQAREPPPAYDEVIQDPCSSPGLNRPVNYCEGEGQCQGYDAPQNEGSGKKEGVDKQDRRECHESNMSSHTHIPDYNQDLTAVTI